MHPHSNPHCVQVSMVLSQDYLGAAAAGKPSPLNMKSEGIFSISKPCTPLPPNLMVPLDQKHSAPHAPTLVATPGLSWRISWIADAADCLSCSAMKAPQQAVLQEAEREMKREATLPGYSTDARLTLSGMQRSKRSSRDQFCPGLRD